MRQALPQRPQWLSLLRRSIQPPKQTVGVLSGHLMMHCPLAQNEPDSQAFPHVPQFLVSLARSTHCSLQLVVPGAQPHLPSMHRSMVLHWTLQLPQFRVSVLVSKQPPLQSVGVRLGQASRHRPPAQTCPLEQAFPHCPQCFVLLVKVTHTPPHNVSPVGHWHSPWMHSCPPVQAFPQRPQCCLSVNWLTHAF